MASWLLKSCTSPNPAMARCSTDPNPDSNFALLTIDELQPWTKLEADSSRFLLCHRRSLKLDSSDSSSAIDELRQLTSSTQYIAG
ncbi:hypothetical protein TorRG33x02_240060 [Trema orientale]|uniref:Uncharacterized protein n=1 Tax=Trema orientale TaxID=63057 RepID=A0A2P5DWG6_TREOI|nr:hypothetical protein TorRG33x02_240030 [Trema orientale]PON77636.1 hypothetical protein TorRG33x02_240060 [Trema orientale]